MMVQQCLGFICNLNVIALKLLKAEKSYKQIKFISDQLFTLDN